MIARDCRVEKLQKCTEKRMKLGVVTIFVASAIERIRQLFVCLSYGDLFQIGVFPKIEKEIKGKRIRYSHMIFKDKLTTKGTAVGDGEDSRLRGRGHADTVQEAQRMGGRLN